LDRRPSRWRTWLETKTLRYWPKRFLARDWNVDRREVAKLLGDFGEQARPAVPALLRASADANWDVQENASVALTRIGEPAAGELAAIICDGRDRALSERAAMALERMHPRTRSALPRLVDEFSGLPENLQILLAPVLGRSAAEHPRIIGVLGEVARSSTRLNVRLAALKALALSPVLDDDLKTLMNEGLSDPMLEVRFHSAAGLWRTMGDHAAALPAIASGLTNGALRIEAVTLLGEMGEAAGPAVPELVRVLADERVYRPLRTPPSAGIALSRIGDRALEFVAPLLQSTNAQTRLNAVITIGLFGPRGGAQGRDLLPLLSDPEREVRFSAALSLSSVGLHVSNAVPVLFEILDEDDPFLVTWAGDALAKIDSKLAPGNTAR
ncbi:MAG TPA: hypothetical protein DCY13_13520, partial [Verrucomicrobiales bacterium]|nr:hypothetical protein [Verrucomicrobiales bacterium]